jgi:hypothetical protein
MVNGKWDETQMRSERENEYSGDLDAINDRVRSRMEKQRRDPPGMKTVAILMLSTMG